jgi:hypothetical protein
MIRLTSGTANSGQVELIVRAWQRGRIREGDGSAISGTSVSIAGDSNAAIIVGNGNLVLDESSAVAQVLRECIRTERPQRLHQLPPEEPNFQGP